MDRAPKRIVRAIAAGAFVALTLMGPLSWAQSPEDEAVAPQPAASEPVAEENNEDATEAGEPLEKALPEDPNDPLYWAIMRDIYTVQKRRILKEDRWAFGVYGGIIPNNIFERYWPVGLRINYFVLENIGLELSGSYTFRDDTGLQGILTDDNGVDANDEILLGDLQLGRVSFGLTWSPIAGKTSFLNEVINYFDLFLFAGFGAVFTETTPDFGADPEFEPKPEGSLGVGTLFFFNDHAALRVDFRQFIFAKVAGVGGVANPSEISLGFSWFL